MTDKRRTWCTHIRKVRDKARSTIRHWFHWSPGLQRSWWKGVQQISAVGVAAAAGTLISNAFAPPASGGDPALSGPWAVIVFCTLMVAVSSLSLLDLHRNQGTLYYVRHQFPAMADWHDQHLQNLVGRGPKDMRALSRDIPNQLPPGGLLDLADDILELSRAFEAQSNTDDATSGFGLAPDMQWMSALAFGSSLYGRWDYQQLYELNPTKATAEGNRNAEFQWDLRRGPSDPSEFADVSVNHHAFAAAEGKPAAVLVTINLTSEKTPLAVLQGRASTWRLSHWYGVGRYTNKPSPIRWNTAYDKDVKVDTVAESSVIHPWTATLRSVEAIRRAAYAHPNSVILLSLSVPKTVAIAIGWHLMRDDLPGVNEVKVGLPILGSDHNGQPFVRDSSANGNLWRRLVPLYFDQESRTLVPTRVHRAQPSAFQLAATLKTLERDRGEPTPTPAEDARPSVVDQPRTPVRVGDQDSSP